MKKGLHPAFIRCIQWGILIIIAYISIFVGVKEMPFLGMFSLDQEQMRVLIISRFPRLLSILITGSSLSICGLIMQTITQNRFMSPTTAGTAEWCRFGVMLVILLFPGTSVFFRVTVAFIVSAAGTMLFMGILARIQYQNVILVPLIGMMLGSVVSAVTTFFAYQFDIIQNMNAWLLGNFSLVIQGNYELLYLSIPFMLLGYLYANHFTIAGMGKDMTTGLGLNHAHIMRVGLVIVALISSITIVSVGNIPFLGLIIPNIVSLYRGDSLKKSLFDTAWLGALFVLVCDMAGRMLIFPYEVSIGVMVSVIGSIIFLLILFRRNKHAAI